MQPTFPFSDQTPLTGYKIRKFLTKRSKQLIAGHMTLKNSGTVNTLILAEARLNRMA
jgi:hypothetical protein